MTPGPFADLIDDGPGEVIDRGGGRCDIVFRRRIRKPLEKVWAALTVPARIADWLANADVDLRVGGHFELFWTTHDHRMRGTITELEPPHLIAWTWPHDDHPDSIVRWELQAEGDGCLLRLSQSGLTKPGLLGVAAGWHTHLEGLPGAAEGTATPWQVDREREIVRLYEALSPA